MAAWVVTGLRVGGSQHDAHRGIRGDGEERAAWEADSRDEEVWCGQQVRDASRKATWGHLCKTTWVYLTLPFPDCRVAFHLSSHYPPLCTSEGRGIPRSHLEPDPELTGLSAVTLHPSGQQAVPFLQHFLCAQHGPQASRTFSGFPTTTLYLIQARGEAKPHACLHGAEAAKRCSNKAYRLPSMRLYSRIFYGFLTRIRLKN